MREDDQQQDQTTAASDSQNNVQNSVPAITLPKGGGAIRGIGEKLAANPVTGTGSLSIPIAISPGRSGFGPQLSLSYDSGAGNGPFGLGWNLSLPSITRKTDKGLPKYQDADKPDVYILSGAEDLVPEFEKDAEGDWVLADGKPVIHDKLRTINGITYQVRRYRPRIEGLFARIERWTNQSDPSDSFWRSISKDNITTWYGKTYESRIFDPENPDHIFSWLICESYDDKGNVISYEYKSEDSNGINLFQVNERNRKSAIRSAQSYLKYIKYGNITRYFPNIDPTLPSDWMFETVFDYGEHDINTPRPDDSGNWLARNDPFSNYRPGFELRTYRLCQRVLMFHHFADEAEVGENCLIRSTDFNYHHQQSPTDPRNPIHTVIDSVTQCSYQKQTDNSYLKKILPPVEFGYSPVIWGDKIESIASDSTENLPTGVDGSQYQWVDLDGEGLSGVLTEQDGAWFYKHNESPVTRLLVDNQLLIHKQPSYTARLGATQVVKTMPAGSLTGTSNRQFLDLAGNGQIDLVSFSPPLSGFYERTAPISKTEEQGWSNFRAFQSIPNINWNDPNLKFIDLTGDGHADILITENEVFTWYLSLAEQGFTQSERVNIPTDEEQGPRVIFADLAQTLFQADFTGDGLTDIVRIRNGEVCYWPNLGYGRFGAKVTMDNAPHFDHPDQFHPNRLRLTDIDGSGTIDIIYLGRNKTQFWFNQSGNGWSDPHILEGFPSVDNIASVAAVDLLGNGTACLVWSSPLPGEAHAPMRYIELMAAGKPHLLINTKNNLGAETDIQYAPSTYFYLKDKQAGKPWITKLPFPVHVVEKVTVTDKWNKTTFSSTYSYHHGYFDGVEREFRGFGRVEQIDTETYGEFAKGNIKSPYITDDHTLYQPPIKTVTWYHTGAMIDREKILSQFKHEYFPNWLAGFNPGDPDYFHEAELPEPEINEQNLDAEEFREAMRACKGMVLRQEVYELDVDALEQGQHQPVKLFSTAYHNCHIQCLQARAMNRHAVFLVTESEAITYQYELDLQANTLTPDPRIAHTLNLNIDEYGNVLQAIAVVYPRIGEHRDDMLEPPDIQRIHDVQDETHIAYTESHFTGDINAPAVPDSYRLRVPCEGLSYELTGISPEGDYFTLDELQGYRLSLEYQTTGLTVPIIDYHQLPNHSTPQKRLVEHSKILYFSDTDRSAPEFLREPLPFGEQGNLGLPYETYTLALTDDLLNAILAGKLTPDIQTELDDAAKSGYLSGTELAARFSDNDTTGEYWIRSGIAGFSDDAADHFFLPERYIDAFDQTTTLIYDSRDLYIQSSTDPAGNTVSVEKFDFRVLAPRQLKDINDNLSEVVFDVLGLPAATAVKGKGEQADNLSGFAKDLPDFTEELLNPDTQTQINFFIEARAATETIAEHQQRQQAEAQRLLGNATARHLTYFGEIEEILTDGTKVIHWGVHAASACGIIREQHVAQLGTGESSPMQLAFEYSDGGGNVLVAKVQAEPENSNGPLRWIANGKTILNNKGNPVKQYEPYFCKDENGEPDHRFEEPREQGVTPIIYYDAADRVVRTESPDGSYSRVEFSPWHVSSYDSNDTAYNTNPDQQSDWYQRRTDPAHPLFTDFNTPEHQRAASQTEDHADTPATVLLDSLGREVISIAYNRVKDNTGTLLDEKYLTFTKLDAEGKPLWIRDARGNLVMQYNTPIKPTRSVDEPDPLKPENIPAASVPAYDIAGNLLFQHSMDGGDRWLINDAAGQPFYAWDANERAQDDGSLVLEQRIYRTTYDQLRRPLTQQLKINEAEWQVIERIVYGETLTDAKVRNLCGQVYRHYDGSGLIRSESFDFKGNLLQAQRQMNSAYDAPLIHWPDNPAPDALEAEVYIQKTEYDALNRMARQENWHLDVPDHTPAVYTPHYNERGLLKSETLSVRDQITEAILTIEYGAKDQRTRIQYGNGTSIHYHYDPLTFRLVQLRTTRSSPGESLPKSPSNLSDPNVLQNLYYTYDPVGNISSRPSPTSI